MPASIVAESSSRDVIIKEGDTVVLTCNATGIPQPEVSWYRRSSLAFKLGHHAKRIRKYGVFLENDLFECHCQTCTKLTAELRACYSRHDSRESKAFIGVCLSVRLSF